MAVWGTTKCGFFYLNPCFILNTKNQFGSQEVKKREPSGNGPGMDGSSKGLCPVRCGALLNPRDGSREMSKEPLRFERGSTNNSGESMVKEGGGRHEWRALQEAKVKRMG